jgi:DNA relaxase NicK
MKILVDYLVLTTKIHSLQELKNMLYLNKVNWEVAEKSYYRYQNCIYYEGVKIHWTDGREDICLDISGRGCRAIETNVPNFDWYRMLENFKPYIIPKTVHLSRIDIACDDTDNLLDFDKMAECARTKSYSCRSRFCTVTDCSERIIMFGSPKSDRRLRIYDKALEQGLQDLKHWIRLEMQMRNQSANGFVLIWLDMENLGTCYLGILKDYINFLKKPVKNGNYSRAEIAKWWQNFIGEVERIKNSGIHEPATTLDEEFIIRLMRNYASTIKTFLAINGNDLNALIPLLEDANLNDRQEKFLERWFNRGEYADVGSADDLPF